MRLREKPDLTGPSLFAAGPQMSGRPESLPLPPPAFTCNFGAFLDLVLAEQGGKPSFSRMSEPTSCKYKAGGSLSDQREKPG